MVIEMNGDIDRDQSPDAVEAITEEASEVYAAWATWWSASEPCKPTEWKNYTRSFPREFASTCAANWGPKNWMTRSTTPS
jgi:hypothetical protein